MIMAIVRTNNDINCKSGGRIITVIMIILITIKTIIIIVIITIIMM